VALTEQQIFDEAKKRGIGHIPRDGAASGSLLIDVYPYNCRAKLYQSIGSLTDYCHRYKVTLPTHEVCRTCQDRYGSKEDYLRPFIELLIENENKNSKQKEMNDLRDFVEQKLTIILESLKNKAQYQGLTQVQILASLVKERI